MSPYVFHTRVAYSDIGPDLHLSMTGALRMMQEAAAIHSAHSGYSVLDIARTRVVWLLVQWRVRMTGKIKWNENVDVTTWPQTMERATSVRCFRITDEAGIVIAIAESTWMLLNVDTGRAARITPEVAAAYDLITDGVFETAAATIPHPAGDDRDHFVVPKRDLDTNHHVNNLIYLDYAKAALPDALAEQEFSEAIIKYHRQLLLGDPVHSYYQETEQGHVVHICGDDPKHVHCSILLVP